MVVPRTRETLRRTETWRRVARGDGVLDLLDLLDPCWTAGALVPLEVGDLAWDRTLDRGPSDPSGPQVLWEESFWDPFLVVLK